MIDSWQSCFSFLNRSIPIFSREQVIMKSREKRLIPIEAPFMEAITGMAIIKIVDKEEKIGVMLNLNSLETKQHWM